MLIKMYKTLFCVLIVSGCTKGTPVSENGKDDKVAWELLSSNQLTANGVDTYCYTLRLPVPGGYLYRVSTHGRGSTESIVFVPVKVENLPEKDK